MLARVVVARVLAPRLAVAVGLLVGASACKRGHADGPPCGAAGAKFFALATDDLERAKPTDEVRRAITVQLPAMRDSLVHVCTEGGWSPSVRACLVAASDRTAFEACELQLTEEQRRALDRATRGEPTGDPAGAPGSH